MSRERPREEELFLAAIDLPTPEDRRAFVERSCREDPELRQALFELLAADVEEQGTPAPALPDPAHPAGLPRIGPYRLVERIGEGGMGVVYLAMQETPVARRVALKLIRPGAGSAEVIARFEAERQALALMDHPNIARVLDAGTTSARPGDASAALDDPLSDPGRPYFVMELVEGTPITEYCDAQGLSLRARLELFIPVCLAIEHAHQKGVIHRDVKPSNVLVSAYDGRPVPKVIDFGVAKALGQPLTERTLSTRIGQLLGTLEYMSPEQARLDLSDTDTRSDIYSLGVLLYELITGSTPLDRDRLRNTALEETLRIIREEPSPRPSTRFGSGPAAETVARRRGSDVTRLSRAIRGGVDAIAMKALAKERDRRYQTASALAEDVRRFLAGEPLDAAPPSASERWRMLARRHRRPVIVAATILFLLVAGVAGTTVGLIRERRASATARARLASLEQAIELLGSVFEDLDPRSEAREGRQLRAILGERLDRAAAELETDAIGEPAITASLQDRLGRTYLGLGFPAKAERLLARYEATRAALLGADHPDALSTLVARAHALREEGKYPAACALFDEVRKGTARRFGAGHPSSLGALQDLAWTYGLAGRRDEGIALLEAARDEHLPALGTDHPAVLELIDILAGLYIGAGRAAEAIAPLERVHAARVKMHGPSHSRSLAALSNLANANAAAFHMRKALALWEEARDQIVPELGDDHPTSLIVLDSLAWMYRAFGRHVEAIELGEHILAKRRLRLGNQHPQTIHTLDSLALAYRASGNRVRELELQRQALAGLEAIDFEHSEADRIIDNACEAFENSGQFAEAEIWRRRLLELCAERGWGSDETHREQWVELGDNQLAQGHPADAEASFRAALPLLAQSPAGGGEEISVQARLGEALAAQREFAEAETLLIGAHEALTRLAETDRGHTAGPPRDRRLASICERLVRLYEAWERPEESARWQRELDSLGTAVKSAERSSE